MIRELRVVPLMSKLKCMLLALPLAKCCSLITGEYCMVKRTLYCYNRLTYVTRFTPGRVLFINNWRVLHGRSSYRGQRTLTGCYVTMGNLLSRARMLKLIC
uniref:Trimethyllysine dioxygenase, mitochondrial n=1 Tax=Cacopsylla melanoneura TaxID=428564 RepID=A0A8D8LZZ9_9HEMI